MQESFLSRQKFCRDKSHDKHTFVVTKEVVCHDKTFIAMKMILVAAPTNDTYLTMYLWWSLHPLSLPTRQVTVRRLRSLLLCLCDVFRALINSLIC